MLELALGLTLAAIAAAAHDRIHPKLRHKLIRIRADRKDRRNLRRS